MPCPSDQTTLARGLVGAELFWNSNGAFNMEKHFKECQTPSTFPSIIFHQWENKMRVEVRCSPFPPSTGPTSSLG